MALPLVTGLAPIVGGILGNLFGGSDRAKAEQAAQEAYRIIEELQLPPDLSQAVLLQKFQKAGVYTPELEQAINLGVSQVSQIQEDPALRQAQLQALSTLQERGKTGMTPEERLALNKIRTGIQRDLEGKRQQILQNLQARGMGGSGAELAAALQASQGSANQASEESDRAAAMASQQALAALTQSGVLGGQIRGQDFDINRARAAAADEFNRFNVEQQIARQARNIGSKNTAQQYNLSESQRIADANVSQGNRELLRQNDARRQYWKDLADRAGMLSKAKLGESNIYTGNAANTADTFQGIGSGIGAAAGAYGNYLDQQETRAQENAHKAADIAYQQQKDERERIERLQERRLKERELKLKYDPEGYYDEE